MSAIVCEKLSIAYPTTSLFRRSAKSFKALDKVSFELKSGDKLGLVGENGAGKSTLLRALAGIYHPTEGRVFVEGTVSSVFSLGMGMQPEYTGLKNIKLSLVLAGVPKSDRARLIEEIISFSELGEFIHSPVYTYSSGMAMRLKFACETAIKPDILLLDEWIGAGDQQFQAKATERMKDLVSEAGILVLATHNVPLMKTVCNKALWLSRGKVQQFGDIERVIKMREELKVYGKIRSIDT